MYYITFILSLLRACISIVYTTEVFRPHETSESNHWNRNFLRPISSRGQFNKTFTIVIYKCCYLFSDSKTMATLVNYTCKSFTKLAPAKFKAPSTGIRVKKNVRIRRVDVAKITWLWLNWFGRILAVLIYRESKIGTGLIERRFYLYFRFQEWSICLIYNKILFLTSLRSKRLEVVGTRSLILREPAARSVGAERDNWW